MQRHFRGMESKYGRADINPHLLGVIGENNSFEIFFDLICNYLGKVELNELNYYRRGVPVRIWLRLRYREPRGSIGCSALRTLWFLPKTPNAGQCLFRDTGSDLLKKPPS